MKNFKNTIVGLSALAVASTLSISAFAEEWRGWNIHKPGYPNTVAMDKFAELLNKKTGGEITLKMFCSGKST
jgi:TRAP-type C4-dicarboxylate transport system substrate-binding protein